MRSGLMVEKAFMKPSVRILICFHFHGFVIVISLDVGFLLVLFWDDFFLFNIFCGTSGLYSLVTWQEEGQTERGRTCSNDLLALQVSHLVTKLLLLLLWWVLPFLLMSPINRFLVSGGRWFGVCPDWEHLAKCCTYLNLAALYIRGCLFVVRLYLIGFCFVMCRAPI